MTAGTLDPQTSLVYYVVPHSEIRSSKSLHQGIAYIASKFIGNGGLRNLMWCEPLRKKQCQADDDKPKIILTR